MEVVVICDVSFFFASPGLEWLPIARLPGAYCAFQYEGKAREGQRLLVNSNKARWTPDSAALAVIDVNMPWTCRLQLGETRAHQGAIRRFRDPPKITIIHVSALHAFWFSRTSRTHGAWQDWGDRAFTTIDELQGIASAQGLVTGHGIVTEPLAKRARRKSFLPSTGMEFDCSSAFMFQHNVDLLLLCQM
jgi:hypothetical protein